MGRMLDALKNLENDAGSTMAVTAPVVAKQPDKSQPSTKSPSSSLPVASEGHRSANAPAVAGQETIGNAFLSKLASSSRPAVESERSVAATSAVTQSQNSASAAAAALAKLKSANASPLQGGGTLATSPQALAQTVTPGWPGSATSGQLPKYPPTQTALPAAPVSAAPLVAPLGEQTISLPVAPVTAIEVPPLAQAEISLPAQRTSATRLEETVKAALADPRRSVPLEQLARRMRTELRADAGRCWLLADAGQHHDSTDLAAHLGAIFASQLGDVLLVDGNLDCALLSAGMNVIDRPGVAQAAMSGAKSWQNMIQPTSWQHLYLLPAGQMVADMPDPTAAWTEVLSQAERRFRLVLVDGGPATEAACKVFGRLCDATFVVVRLGLTEAREARQSMKHLRTSGARVIGSIATSVPSL